jgi:glycine/D-amino acid oxidase-like deaminating enzyme
MSKGDTTAQVEPRRLCQWLLDKCVERGVGVHQPARVVGLSTDVRDELAGVRVVSLRDEVEFEIPCTKLVITAGPWTPKVFSTLFPSARMTIRITSLAGHSVVLKSPRWNTEHSNADLAASHAVFTTDPSGFNPEFFSRTGGEIWFGGLNSSILPLPPDAGKAKPDPKAIKRMMKIAKRLLGLPEMEDLEIVSEGLCFRPVARSGNPIISRIADKQLGPEIKTRRGGDGGVFASVGHGPWGIALSLGTGRVLADLIEGVEPSCDIRGLQI